MKALRDIPARPLLAPAIVVLLTFGLCVAQEAVEPTIPKIQDEFAYLLAADTYSSGRLTNPVHPLRRHFDVAHVLQMPSYQAKYQPGQGLTLALGQAATGSPLVGVWLSFALACGAVVWMLRAWLPAGWALAGGLMAATSGPWLSTWGATYMGGAVAMLGGALLYGALVRGMRKPRAPWGALVGVGLMIFALTRPYEGLVASVPVAVVLLRGFVHSDRQNRRTTLRALWAPLAVVLALGGAWLAWYNYRVTGDPLKLPYQVYLSQHEPDIFDHPKADVLSDERLARIQPPVLTRFGRQVEVHLGGQALFVLPILLAMPALLRDRWGRFALVTSLLTLGAASLTHGALPHYSAPVAALVVGLLAHSLHVLSARVPGRGLAVLLGCAFAVAWLLASLHYIRDGIRVERAGVEAFRTAEPPASPIPPVEDDERAGERAYWRAYMGAGIVAREQHLQRLENEDGAHLVFVRYLPGSTRYREWAYNHADIDGSKVIWARWIPGEPLWPFRALYPERKIWYVQPEVDPWTLVEFPIDMAAAWHLRQHGSARASAENMLDPEGPTRVEIADGGDEVWSVQLERAFLPVERGRRYEGSFTIHASARRHIRVRIGQGHPPWKGLGFIRSYTIGPEPGTFTFRFTATGSEPLPRLLFELGRGKGEVEVSRVEVRAL